MVGSDGDAIACPVMNVSKPRQQGQDPELLDVPRSAWPGSRGINDSPPAAPPHAAMSGSPA